MPIFIFGEQILSKMIALFLANLNSLVLGFLHFADVMGDDYPFETFRVLKEKEFAEYGEFRTRRLVLEAWEREES